MVSITHALRRIKRNLDSLLSEPYLSQLAGDAGCRWRERRLAPAVRQPMSLSHNLCSSEHNVRACQV